MDTKEKNGNNTNRSSLWKGGGGGQSSDIHRPLLQLPVNPHDFQLQLYHRGSTSSTDFLLFPPNTPFAKDCPHPNRLGSVKDPSRIFCVLSACKSEIKKREPPGLKATITVGSLNT